MSANALRLKRQSTGRGSVQRERSRIDFRRFKAHYSSFPIIVRHSQTMYE
jgi:hypothetical protein